MITETFPPDSRVAYVTAGNHLLRQAVEILQSTAVSENILGIISTRYALLAETFREDWKIAILVQRLLDEPDRNDRYARALILVDKVRKKHEGGVPKRETKPVRWAKTFVAEYDACSKYVKLFYEYKKQLFRMRHYWGPYDESILEASVLTSRELMRRALEETRPSLASLAFMTGDVLQDISTGLTIEKKGQQADCAFTELLATDQKTVIQGFELPCEGSLLALITPKLETSRTAVIYLINGILGVWELFNPEKKSIEIHSRGSVDLDLSHPPRFCIEICGDKKALDFIALVTVCAPFLSDNLYAAMMELATQRNQEKQLPGISASSSEEGPLLDGAQQ